MRLLLDAGYSHLLTRRCGCGKWMLTSMLMTCCALHVLQASAQTHQRAAQIWKNLRSTCLKLSGDTLVIDTLSIVPGSLRVYGVADSDYIVYPLQGYLVWKHWPALDSVCLQYRVLPQQLAAPIFRYSPQLAQQGFVLNTAYQPGEFPSLSRHMPGQLEYSGSLGRSLGFGNNQSVVVGSAMNLQVSGYLPDSIRVEAAVSDQQLPIQPAGNTATLQELDQVYVRFTRRADRVQLGDFDLSGQTYFMRFFKRLQGISFSHGWEASPDDISSKGSSKIKFQLAGAISKGIQARNIFQGQEGNQGPYPLHGNQGELNILVLAGTEKVYLNGQLLQRGVDRDYVIDYNTGQITFTPHRLITSDSRIQVEFEYANQYYQNILWYAAGCWQPTSHIEVNMHVYNNTDNRRNPLVAPLDAGQQQFLRRIGLHTDQAFYPNAVPDTAITQQVLYRRIDTVVNGILYDSVYVFSQQLSTTDTLYRVSFSYVGAGRGDYVLSQSLLNGHVYSWVAPVNNQHQGDYVAAVLLVAPRSQQLVTLSTEARLSPRSTLEGEVAWSRLNVNTFSPAAAHQGMAARLGFQQEIPISHFFSRPASVQTQLRYTFTSPQFQALQPYRPMEFNRDWSLPLDSILAPANEHLISFSTGIAQPEGLSLNYLFQGYWRSLDALPDVGFRGLAHQLNWTYTYRQFSTQAQLAFTHVFSPTYLASMWKPIISLAKTWHVEGNAHWEWRVSWRQEKDAIKATQADTLLPNSYDFQETTIVMERQALWGNIGFSANYRSDLMPRGKAGFGNGVQGKTYRLFGSREGLYHQIQGELAYRNVHIQDSGFLFHRDTSRTDISGGRFLTGQVIDHVATKNGFLDHHLVYTLTGGQQQELAYTYVEVPTGQGQYIWIDYNHDGIAQTNEFQPASFKDQGNYVRIYTPGSRFLPTRLVQWDQQWTLTPARFWSAPPSRLARWLSQLRVNSRINLSRQRLAGSGFLFNPFQRSGGDSAWVNSHTEMMHSVFIHQLSASWNLNYTYQWVSDCQQMLYGQQMHALRQHTVRLHWNAIAGYSFSGEWTAGRTVDSLAGQAEQRYDYTFQSWAPTVQYVPNTQWRVEWRYNWEHKQNAIDAGGESYSGQAITGMLNWSRLATMRLEISCTCKYIRFRGATSSAAGFSMLEGLMPGRNWLWHIGCTRRLAGNIELDFIYEGRKTATARVIHTGTATIRAVF